MDVQTCHIDLASYAYTTDDIEYEWKNVGEFMFYGKNNSKTAIFDQNLNYVLHIANLST